MRLSASHCHVQTFSATILLLVLAFFFCLFISGWFVIQPLYDDFTCFHTVFLAAFIFLVSANVSWSNSAHISSYANRLNFFSWFQLQQKSFSDQHPEISQEMAGSSAPTRFSTWAFSVKLRQAPGAVNVFKPKCFCSGGGSVKTYRH